MTPAFYSFPPLVEGDTSPIYVFSVSGELLTGCKSQLRDKYGNLAKELDVSLSGNSVIYNSWRDESIKRGTYSYDLQVETVDDGTLTIVSGHFNVLPQITR